LTTVNPELITINNLPSNTLLSVSDAVVLCGGLGTRLQAVVSDRPKPMAAIGDRPFLALLLDFLHAQGVRRFILAAGHKADWIEKFFASSALPYEVAFSVEKKRMGTGGALLLARSLVTRHPTAVVNGDSFCEVDMQAMFALHRRHRAFVSIAVTRAKPVGEYGEVLFGSDGRISTFTEKGPSKGEGWVNAGIYIFSKAALGILPEKTPSSLERDFFPVHVRSGMYAFKCHAPLLDIGTPDRLERARVLMATLAGTGRRPHLQNDASLYKRKNRSRSHGLP
jgi:NDP-sugar pyrophosphorylase family protein